MSNLPQGGKPNRITGHGSLKSTQAAAPSLTADQNSMGRSLKKQIPKGPTPSYADPRSGGSLESVSLTYSPGDCAVDP